MKAFPRLRQKKSTVGSVSFHYDTAQLWQHMKAAVVQFSVVTQETGPHNFLAKSVLRVYPSLLPYPGQTKLLNPLHKEGERKTPVWFDNVLDE